MSDNPSSRETPEVSAFSPQHIVVITELAKAGLAYLTQVVSNPGFKIDHPDPAVAKAQEDHLRGLVKVSGPDTVAHFDRICGYLYEHAKKSASPDGRTEFDQSSAPAEKGGK